MDEKARKRAVSKAIKQRDHDIAARAEHNRHCTFTFCIMSLFYMFFVIFIAYVISEGSYDLFDLTRVVMFFGGPVGSLVSLIFISETITRRTPLMSSGYTCTTVFSFITKTICYIEASIPMNVLVFMSLTDEITRELTVPFWKVLVYSPLIFIGILLLSLFMGSTPAYSNKTDSKVRSVMTKSDWSTLRQTQKLAGVDPDKMPVVLSASQMKKMSASDWSTLAYDMKLAGYDVFEKHGGKS